jgi:G3E family GTPase
VIETTGLADPTPLLATLAGLPLVAARYALAGVVTTVDAEHGARTLERHPEALRQVAVADRLVITKCDRSGAGEVDALEAILRAIAPGARSLRSSRADVDPADVLDAGLYRSADAPTADARGWLRAGDYRLAGRPSVLHDPGITSFAWSAAEPLPWAGVERALETLVRTAGASLLRMKGLVNVPGEPGPRAVHAVGHTLYPSARLASWPDEDRATRLVFIGCGLEEAAITQIFESIPR